jgi:hypothetical protein
LGNDTLGTNQALRPGNSLTSADGTTVLTLGTDGNLALTYEGRQLWTSGTSGKPVDHLWMGYDGNLRLNDASTTSPQVFWSNGASGHKDAFLRVNNGGSMMVWDGSNHQIWDSGTTSPTGPRVNPIPGGAGAKHTDFGGIDQFLKEAANTAGDVLSVVGPIAAIVVNVIPGIGQAASLAICAGIAAATAAAHAAKAVLNNEPGALAAVASAVADAVPGGDDPSVQAAVETGAGAVSAIAGGQPVGPVLASAVASAAPQFQGQLTSVGNALASGLAISSPQVSALMNTLPPNLQAGLHIGALTGNSAIIGASTTPDASTLTAFEHLGLQREATDAVSAHGRLLAGAGTRGFDIGIGSSLNNISQSNLAAVRNQLSPADQKGFDMALALHIGRTVSPPPPPGLGAAGAAGYGMTMGMGSAPAGAKAAMMGNIAAHPAARPGAVAAVAAKTGKDKDEGWLHRFLHWLGLVPA